MDITNIYRKLARHVHARHLGGLIQRWVYNRIHVWVYTRPKASVEEKKEFIGGNH